MSIPTFNGSAIPVLTVPPNWTTPVELSVRHTTNIAESLSLVEERQTLAPRPLYGLRFRAMTRSAKELGYLKTVVDLAADLPVAVPLWPLAARLTAAASLGATSLTLDDTSGCLFDVFGDFALLWERFDAWEVVQLSGVTQFGASLAAGTANAYTAAALLLPLGYGSLTREGVTARTDIAGEWRCKFDEMFHGLTGQGTPEDVPASAPADPASPPALALWLKADFADLPDGTVIGDGTHNWTDSSGNGHTCAQATSGKRPVYKRGAAGDKPGILFTAASSQCLNFDGVTRGFNAEFTFVAVIKKQTAAAGFVMGTAAGSPGILDTAPSDEFAAAETSRMAIAFTYRVTFSTSTTAYRENKVPRGTVDGPAPGVTWNQIGASEMQPEAQYFNGYVFELMLWSGALTEAQLDELYDGYLKPKWDLP